MISGVPLHENTRVCNMQVLTSSSSCQWWRITGCSVHIRSENACSTFMRELTFLRFWPSPAEWESRDDVDIRVRMRDKVVHMENGILYHERRDTNARRQPECKNSYHHQVTRWCHIIIEQDSGGRRSEHVPDCASRDPVCSSARLANRH